MITEDTDGGLYIKDKELHFSDEFCNYDIGHYVTFFFLASQHFRYYFVFNLNLMKVLRQVKVPSTGQIVLTCLF